MSPRYVYLVTRLRSRQITMEEATELFSIQQSMIRQTPRRSLGTPRATSAGTTAVAASPTTPGVLPMNEESLALSLIALGAGAGILAAILKRAQDGERPRPASR